MKKTLNTTAEYSKNEIADFVTEFQKDCISRISVLCKKKNNAGKRSKILGCVSVILCFTSAVLLMTRFIPKIFFKKDVNILSAIAAIFSVISIVSAVHSKKAGEREAVYEKDIAFFEDAVNMAEEKV